MDGLFAIKLLLALVAIYCGSAWVWLAVSFWLKRKAVEVADNAAEVRRDVQANTFHLGLCFILAIGFLGQMVY